MAAYILRRLLLIIPTLIGILTINFLIIQAAPGGPVEQTIAQLEGLSNSSVPGSAGGGDLTANLNSNDSSYRGARGLDPRLVAEIEALYGFDKPAHERYFQMLGNYLTFDFGKSFYSDKSVIDLIIEKLPVSISLGLWTTLLTYLISVPLGIRKAVKDGSSFDVWSSTAIIIGYAIPNFLFAILLIVLFAGGSYFDWFPLR
jgi:microcin C transport system permease protein